jgi:hypothetical protein
MNNCPTNQINNVNIQQTENNSAQSMEEFLKAKQLQEDQVDYQFIQRIIQELTQSCALPLPIPASAIPPLIIQAAQWFWQNCDFCLEERVYLLKNSEFRRCCDNKLIKLPPQIMSVFGVYKVNPNYYYGQMGDFSLERLVINNTILASGAGGSLTDTYGNGSGYNLTDMMAGLYEIQTFKAMFDVPLTYNYNEFSNYLNIIGDLGPSDIVIQTFIRCKIQDLYKNYYFFRLCVCFGLRSMATIMGAFTFRLPGGSEINYQVFRDMANEEIQKIEEWVQKNHSADYFFNSNTV